MKTPLVAPRFSVQTLPEIAPAPRRVPGGCRLHGHAAPCPKPFEWRGSWRCGCDAYREKR